MPDSPDLFLNLTANDYWYFLTRIYDLEASQVEERLTDLMATFDLTESRYNLILPSLMVCVRRLSLSVPFWLIHRFGFWMSL